MDSDITTLTWTVQQFNLDRYFHVALITVYVVDYFDTLATEIDSLWPAPWTTVKIAFFFARYTPFIDIPLAIVTSFPLASAEACTLYLKIQVWSAAIGMTFSYLLLLFRVYGLVGRTRLSTITLSLLAFFMIALPCSFTPLVQKNLQVADISTPSIFPKCFVAASHWVVIVPISNIFYETVFFAMMCWAKVTRFKGDQNWLTGKIYRDVFLYYFALLAIAILGTTVWFAAKGPIRDLSSTVPRSFVSMISCRVILNIRKYASLNMHQNFNGGRVINSGGITQPVSRLRCASAGQESAIDTELRLR